MKNYLLCLCAASSIFAFSPVTVLAQEEGSMSDDSRMIFQEGARELFVSGAGTSDKDFDNNIFNLSASVGNYLSKCNLVGVRQSVSANNNQDEDETDWNGSTRIFYDYHFDMYPWRPFVGLSAGYIYGETTEESWIAGPEAGLKYYILGKSFVSAMIEYQFLFDDADEADNQFDDGVYIYSLGLGLNF